MIDSLHSAGCAVSGAARHWLKLGGIAALGLAIAGGVAFQAIARTVEAGPQRLDDTRSLADLIERNGTVHIVYVHGIREEGPGFAEPLAEMLTSRLGFGRDAPPPDTVIDLPPRPPATILGAQVWTDQEWRASRPFVRHYRLRKGGKEIRIDEVNYWPLLFLLKCRYLMVPEHDLAGDDKPHLALCDRSDAPYHPLLRDSDRARLATKPRGGHA